MPPAFGTSSPKLLAQFRGTGKLFRHFNHSPDNVSCGPITAIKARSRTWLRSALNKNPDKARLALNTYCRPFLVPPNFVGIWCPEGRNIRLTCFDPDQLKAFDLAEVAGWFKPSADRIYSATAPIADFEVP